MKRFGFVIVAAMALLSAPSFVTASAQAQGVDVRIGDDRRGGPAVRIGRERGRDCRTVKTTEWRNGRRVTKTVRRCRGDR